MQYGPWLRVSPPNPIFDRHRGRGLQTKTTRWKGRGGLSRSWGSNNCSGDDGREGKGVSKESGGEGLSGSAAAQPGAEMEFSKKVPAGDGAMVKEKGGSSNGDENQGEYTGLTKTGEERMF